MKPRPTTFSIAVILVLTLIAPLMAQPLADRVPADAIVYIGWSGTDGLPPSYNATHLKAILDNSRMRELLTEFLPQLVARLSAQDRSLREPLQLAQAAIVQVSKHPTAIWFGGIDLSDPRRAVPRIALVCDAGADAPEIERQIVAPLAQARARGNSLIGAARNQNLIILSFGFADAPAVSPGASLKALPAFAAAMKQVQADPLFCGYIDLEKTFDMAQSLAAANNPQAASIFSRIMDGLGIRGMKRGIATAGFDGADWMSRSFLELSGPRTGVLEAFDPRPLTPEMLKAIPADATYAAAGRFDAAKLLNNLRNAAGQIDPAATRAFDQVMGAVQLAIARNPITDILEPLGADWGIYCSPSAAGNGLLGMVIVNHLDDPAKAEASLPTAWINLSNWLNVALSRNKAGVQVSGQMTEIGGSRIYYAGTPIAAPAWTIKDGNLYMGLYPQSVAGATSAVFRTAGHSILDNEKFVALQKRLGVTNPTGFVYMDLPSDASSGSMYQKLLVLGRYAGISDLFGVTLPEPLLPPLNILQEHIAPAGAFGWVDDAGYHTKSISPFPGAVMLSEPTMLTTAAPASAGMMAAILLPSLNRARETANRVKCAANLKMLGNGILLYANENQGKYPPDMATLVTFLDSNGMMAPRGVTLICPSSANPLPPNLAQMTVDQYAAWANDNSSYVYMGGNLTTRTANAQRIVIYEKPDDHANQGINMLYGDGHVDWMQMQAAIQLIQRQQAGR